MKFKLSLKDKEASLDADVERLVEKGMELNAEKPPKKTRYQIRAEEKRKNEELKHKQRMQAVLIMLGFVIVLLIFGIIAKVFNLI